MTSNITERKSIFELNPNNLQDIFSYLSVVDRLKLILTNERFVELLLGHIRTDLIEFSAIQDNFKFSDVKQILSKCGQHIKRIQLESTTDNSIKYHRLIALHCHNLEEINFNNLQICKRNTYGDLLHLSKHVQILKFTNCWINDGACLLISELAETKVFSFERSQISLTHLSRLKNIIDLNLKKCGFKFIELIKIFKMNQLKTLNIVDCQEISDIDLLKLVQTQPRLEHLIVSRKYNSTEREVFCYVRWNLKDFSMRQSSEKYIGAYLNCLMKQHEETLQCLDINFSYSDLQKTDQFLEFVETKILNRIMSFRNLKVLCLSYCWLFQDGDLAKLTKSSPQLEMVDLTGSQFTENGILACVENWKKLKYLDISYCCVRRGLYNLLVDVRVENRRRKQLTVYIKPKTTMAKWINTKLYESTKHIVKLSLEPMRLHEDDSMLQRLHHLKNTAAKHKRNAKIAQKETSTNGLQRSLSILDENCLHHIMSFLNLIEKLTLVLTSTRFDEIFRYFLHIDQFDMSQVLQHITLRETRNILQRFGSEIRKLKLQPSECRFNPEYHELAAEYCTDLTELHCIDVEAPILKRLISSSRRICHLILKCCNIDNDILNIISESTELKVLKLNDTDATGAHLEKLSGLTELYLRNCPRFNTKHFNAICKANKLKILNICGCRLVYEIAIETQTDLERISFDKLYTTRNYEIIGKLNSLIDISLRNCNIDDLSLLLQTVKEYRGDSIKFIAIKGLVQYSSYDSSSLLAARIIRMVKMDLLNFPDLICLQLTDNTIVDNEFMQQIARHLPKLEILNVEKSTNLSDAGIVFAVEHLKNLKHFQITDCKIVNPCSTYNSILEIIKDRSSECLMLYVDPVFYAFSMTKEYEITKNYVALSRSSIKKLNLRQFFEQKSIKRKSSNTVPYFDVNFELPSSKTLLLDLPDRCVSNIMSYLNSTDQLKLVLLHDRFLPTEDVDLDLGDICKTFTLAETDIILSKYGNHLKGIRFLDSHKTKPLNYLNLIRPYIKQLTRFEIGPCQLVREQLYELLSTSEQLEVVKFHKSRCDNRLVLGLVQNKNLKFLTVTEACITGEHLSQLTNLIELNLESCSNLNETFFKEICRKCKLKALDIRYCTQLNNASFVVLVKTQTDLEKLSISLKYRAKNTSLVCQMKNLKHLVLEYDLSGFPLDEFLDNLIRYKKDDLLSLHIINNDRLNVGFSYDEIIEKRVRKFRKLEEIKIDRYEVGLDPYFHTYM